MPGPTLAGKVTLDDSQAAAALRRLEATGAAVAAKLHASVGGAFTSIGKVAAVGTAAAATAVVAGGVMVARGVGQILESGRALQVLSRQTGASVAGLAILQAKFKEAGLDADGIGRSIFRLQKSIAGLEDDENKGGASRIQQLGLSLAALQAMKPDQQFLAVGAALSKMADPAERTGDAMQIFGKAGAELGALFNGGDFAQIPPNLAMNAQILARNSAIFEQVAIKLERVGEITKSFYLGAASGMVKTLGPLFDQLERLNLVVVGAQFGTAVANGAKMLVGAFQLPETAFTYIQNGLAYAFTSGGNVLLAALKTAGDFFQNGMLASLQAIGAAVISTLMRSFDKPIRYLQAGIEAALETAQNLSDRASGKQDDDSVAGQMSDADRKKFLANIKRQQDQIIKAHPDDYLADKHFRSLAQSRAEIENYDPSKYATRVESIPEIMNRHKDDAVRFGIYGGGQTADQWAQAAREKGSEAWSGAKAAASGFKVTDILGASRYQEEMLVAGMKLRKGGQTLLGTGDPTGKPGEGLSKMEAARLTAQAHMALATSHAAPGADPAAFMFMGHSGMPGTARTNATDPYTARVDSERRTNMMLAHTIGIGGALDFDPSTAVGWTGAKNAYSNGTSAAPFKNGTSLSTGGLGGGAYGATGNIWNQVSGKVQNTHKSPEEHLAKIASNTDELVRGLNGTSGGGDGGGGATTTGK